MSRSPDNKKKPKADTNGVEATIRAYDRELHAFLMRRLRGGEESPDDVRQEIYLRMLRFTNSELVREPRAYLFRVAKNVLYDKLLLVQRERSAIEPGEGDAITEDETARVDTQRDLDRILSQLPPMYRAVLLLRISEGMSHVEIAHELKLSVHTVKKYMHSALVQCRMIGLGLK